MAETEILMFESDIPTLENRPSVRSDICIEGCRKKGNYIRCCLCCKWYHVGCLKLPDEESNGIWACMKCRHVADEVSEIHSLTLHLLQDNIQMRDMLKKQQEQFDCFVALQTTTSGFLQDIKAEVTAIKEDIAEGSDSDSEDEFDEYDEPEGRICYSDSLARDCVSTAKDMIFERAGPYINNVRKTVKKLPARKTIKEIILVIGTNDLESKKPAEKIAQECELLVQEALVHAEKVTLSSIPPRADNKVDGAKMDTVNAHYYDIAIKSGATFVDHDKNFKYRDGSIDTSMLLAGDSLHLSTKGTQKFIENLGLDAKPAIPSVPFNKGNRWPGSQRAKQVNGIPHIPSATSQYPPVGPSFSQAVRPGFIPSLLQTGATQAHPNVGMPHVPQSSSQYPHGASSLHQSGRQGFTQPSSSQAQTQHNAGMPNPPLHQPPPTQSSTGPSRRPWPGIRNLPHLKRKRYFRGGHDPLSNFHMVRLSVFGKFFQSLEHAYQWKKAKYLRQDDIADLIMNTSSPGHVKQITDEHLDAYGTDWWQIRQSVMYELLMVKCKQCPAFVTELLQSGDDEIVEDTNHSYWARGEDGQGLNMLGELLMFVREGLRNYQSSSSQQLTDYRPPENGAISPCHKCGEGNHNSLTCRHDSFLQCRKCFYQGHKSKHCPDRQ